jgi:hypothetical protein
MLYRVRSVVVLLERPLNMIWFKVGLQRLPHLSHAGP